MEYTRRKVMYNCIQSHHLAGRIWRILRRRYRGRLISIRRGRRSRSRRSMSRFASIKIRLLIGKKLRGFLHVLVRVRLLRIQVISQILPLIIVLRCMRGNWAINNQIKNNLALTLWSLAKLMSLSKDGCLNNKKEYKITLIIPKIMKINF